MPAVELDVSGAIEMEATEQYLALGRRFEHLTVDDLKERWTISFKIFAKEQTMESLRDHQDVDAELRLRGVERPYNTIKDEQAALLKEIEDEPLDPAGRREERARLRALLSPEDGPKH